MPRGLLLRRGYGVGVGERVPREHHLQLEMPKRNFKDLDDLATVITKQPTRPGAPPPARDSASSESSAVTT